MELRDIEIFLTLADELHFGRAAARLHVSQARVSQAIALQERRLGGRLFDRSNRRRISLTPLGRQLRDDLRPVYADLHDSLERARLAARGISAVLRVGLMPLNVARLQPFWKTFRHRHPEWELRVRLADHVDTFGELRRGDVDALVVWLPVDEPGLTIGPVLFTDHRILAVSAEHELAVRSSVSLGTAADFPLVTAPLMPESWEDGYLPFHTPKGRYIERLRTATTGEELFNLVITGETVHPFPAHVTEHWATPLVRWLPIVDMPSLSFVLVWRTEADNILVKALAEVIRDLGPSPIGGGRA